MTLDEANALSPREFVARFGGVFEHSPWVAERVAPRRPFAGVEALHAAMCAEVDAAGEAAQVALLRAHPELAGKAAIAGEITDDSKREQSGAGLDRCTPAEYAELQVLNAAYRERFGFPFIIAVRGLDRAAILAALRNRVHRSRAEEFAEALRQVERIASFRIDSLLA